MIRFKQVFKSSPVILPVIHVESLDQALRNAAIAHQAGCDGTFLINHTGSCRDLLAVHRAVFAEFPEWWIGVNCLDLPPWEVFAEISGDVAGVWVDNAGIDEHSNEQPVAERISAARAASGWPGLYFGGVAFKYQRPVSELSRAALLASDFMDVVTTSGAGTGQSAQLGKIQTMKQAIGSFPLAIASGVSPENIAGYLPYADCVLVATSISSSWTELDPQRVTQLVAQARPAARDE